LPLPQREGSRYRDSLRSLTPTPYPKGKKEPHPQPLSEPTVTDRREVKERGVISEILSRIHNSEFIIHNYDY